MVGGKKGLFLDQNIFMWGEEKSEGFYHADCLFFLWEMERAHMIDYPLATKFQTG